jgi:hypothetical protein
MTTSTTDQTTASNADQITTPKSNDLVELPIKDAEQLLILRRTVLPTPSRMVPLDLLASNTIRTLRRYPGYN